MDMMSVTQGSTLNETITILNYLDAAALYAGTEVLSGSVRIGRSFPAILPLVAATNLTWVAPVSPATTTNTFTLLIPGGTGAGTTGSLPVGQYIIQVNVVASDANTYAVYEGFLTVDFGVGTDTTPTTYCSYQDLLTYAPWVQKLQTDTGTAGFVVERGLARAWLDNVLVQHSNWAFLHPQIGQPGFMPQAMFPATVNMAPNLWLREQLNLNYLVRRQNVIEITAKKSLYFIGRSQLDAMNEKQERLAMWFGADADRIVSALRAEITLGVADPNNADVWPSVVVDCGRGSLRG